MISAKETEDVQLVMLFSTGALDRQVYTHQQLAFDLLEQHSVPYETLDGSDSSNKAQRNKLWTLVTHEDREYPQFFLRKAGGGNREQRPTWEYFGDIDSLQAAAADWKLLQKLLHKKNPKEEKSVLPIAVTAKAVVKSHAKSAVVARAVVKSPEQSDAADASAPKHIVVKEKTKQRSHNEEKRRTNKNTGAHAAKHPVRATKSDKVICVSHTNNNSVSTSWSMTDHLDKARASTARLDALIAQAALVRERTALRPLKKTHKDRSTKPRQPVSRSFAFLDEKSSPEKNRKGSLSSSSSTSASSSSSSTTPIEESHHGVEKESCGFENSEGTPNDSDSVPVTEAVHAEGNQSKLEGKEEPMKDSSDSEMSEFVEQELESASDISENNTIAESMKSDCTDNAQYPDVEQAFGCVAGLENEGIQEITSKSAEVALLDLSDETEEVDPLEEVLEVVAKAQTNEECEGERRDSDDDNDNFDTEEHDELGDLAIGGFHESFKLPLSKDATETTEMESFSNFADSMGSLGLEGGPSSSKEEFVTYEEVEEEGEDEEEDEEYEYEEVVVDDDSEENMSAPIRKILVLIATQTIHRQVPFDQQNALATLEAHGIDYFTMDGSDPTVKEARDALFELSEIGPRYPQFFQVKGEEVTFLGDMHGLYDAIENKYLGEWLAAATVQ
eukprot:scaffold1001_cov169-Amphora_coffeaeformis.AAC.21